LARAPVLPEATPVGALSALLRRSLFRWRRAPAPTGKVGYDGALCPDHVQFSDIDPERERFFAFCLGYTKAPLQTV
jgi:hypothetical protein